MSRANTLIVGGGVVGLSLAWELARRGRCVRVLDQRNVGRGASWAGAGILPPAMNAGATDPHDQLRALSHRLHPQWAERLRCETGIDTGLRRCGGLYVARSAAELATLAANQFWCQEHDIDYEKLEPHELVRREPALQPVVEEIRGAWFLPDEYQLRNPRHLKALAIACRDAGVELSEHEPVERINLPSQEGSQRPSAQTANGLVEAEQLCLCSGAWARQTLQQLDMSSGIMPVRGQMLLYRFATPLLQHILNEGNRYLVARDDGLLLAGSIEEEVGYDEHTTSDGVAQIQHWAESLLPELRQAELEDSWAGLRPGSYDGLPYMGRIPGCNNVFIAAGHFRSGLHLSCATAVTMADLMQGKPTEIDLSAFRPGRG